MNIYIYIDIYTFVFFIDSLVEINHYFLMNLIFFYFIIITLFLYKSLIYVRNLIKTNKQMGSRYSLVSPKHSMLLMHLFRDERQ